MVVSYHKQKWSQHAIAQQLKCHRSFVENTIKRYKETGDVSDRHRTGRPKKRSLPIEEKLVGLSRGKRHRSTRAVAKIATQRDIATVSHMTVWRAFRNVGLRPFHRQKIPRLLPQQRAKRRAFCVANLNKDWSKTVFTDEKEFVLFEQPNAHNDIVWAGDSGEVAPVELEKWKVVVHAWGAISCQGPIALHFYEPPLTAHSYQELLTNSHFIAAANDKLGENWEFQQDGAPAHTAASTQTWLQAHVPSFISADTWPPNSPDLNPIERVWGILVEKLANKNITTTQGFRRVIRQIWFSIETSTLQRLYGALSNKIQTMRRSRGAVCQQ